MIRRSTLVFLACLAAVGTPAMRAKSAASAVSFEQSSFEQPAQNKSVPQPLLIAQASGGVSAGDLDINSEGEAVRALQVRLQQAGYYSGAIDGLYGLDTQRAVSAFQADAGIAQTGSLNDETYQALREQTASVAGSESDFDFSGADASSPDTEPTASELPAIERDEATAVAAADSQAGGLSRLFGFGLGVAAVLASFGVGFYIANRDKADKEGEGEWGELETSAGLVPSGLAPASGGLQPLSGLASRTASTTSNTTSSAAAQTGSRQNSGNAAVSSSMMSGLGASVAQPLSASGQMGGTAPMAPIDVIEGLIGDLRNPDPAKRRKAIWELGQRGNSLAMQPLVDSMVDADSKEKSLVLAALSEIGIRSLKPMSRALAIALQDDNPEVRKNAIRDLTRVYDLVVQISQMLGHAAEDEDPEVRQTAAWALNQLNRIRRGHDDDPAVRSFSGGSGGGAPSPPIDLLASEASLRRSQQGL